MNKLHSLFFVIAILFLVCSVTSANERIDDGSVSEGRHNVHKRIGKVNDENTDGERDTEAGLIQEDVMYDEDDTDANHDQKDIMVDESVTEGIMVDESVTEGIMVDESVTEPVWVESVTEIGDDLDDSNDVEVTEEELNDFMKIIDDGSTVILEYLAAFEVDKSLELVDMSWDLLVQKLGADGTDNLVQELLRKKPVTTELSDEDRAFQVLRDAAVEKLDEKLVEGPEAVESYLTSLKERENVFLYSERLFQLVKLMGEAKYEELFDKALGMEEVDKAISTNSEAVKTFFNTDAISPYVLHLIFHQRRETLRSLLGDEFGSLSTNLYTKFADTVEERIPSAPRFAGVLPTTPSPLPVTLVRRLRGNVE